MAVPLVSRYCLKVDGTECAILMMDTRLLIDQNEMKLGILASNEPSQNNLKGRYILSA
jgi:hypothetical protein